MAPTCLLQAAEEFKPPVYVVPSTYFVMNELYSTLSLQDRKRILRDEARQRRALYNSRKTDAELRLVEVFLRNIQLDKNAVIASYSAVRDELDPALLNDALQAQGHKIALPVITGKKKPLIFRLYERGDMLLANPLGIFEPTSGAPGVEPDVLLVPLLAFDNRHNRLGYGGGYYDRTVKKLRLLKPVLTIGLAYAHQQVESIPVGPNDVPLDKIITEEFVI